MEIDEKFMNRKISFRGSSLLTIINSIAVTDLLGIVPMNFIIPTVTFLI